MGIAINQDKNIGHLSAACLVSVIGLLTIWVLPNTIAMRHVFLAVGFISALPLISRSHFFARRSAGEILPLLLLLLLFAWVLFHLAFFSLNFALEFGEIRSLWARAFVGAILAIGLRIGLQKYPKLQPYFFSSLFIVSLISIGAYSYLSVKHGSLIGFRDFVGIFVFKKIEAAFFGVLAISIACGNIVYQLGKAVSKKRSSSIAWWISGIAIALFASVINITKNGLGAGVGLCILLAITYFLRSILHSSRTKLKIVLSTSLILVIFLGGWQINRLFDSPGWGNFVEDIQISSRIDEHSYWKRNNPTVFPLNSSGAMVSGNVYERMSWATAGVRLIKAYPLGYGSINRSFVGLLNHAQVEQELESQTHSGWIDFALAFGIPGLLILFSVFISTLWLGLKHGDQFGLMGAWLAIGLLPFGLIAEISYKHNFEILIFFMAFAASSVIRMREER